MIDSDDAASINDRDWFTANPTRSHRLRRSLPGEPESSVVVVRQIEPGLRVRLGFAPTFSIPDREPMLAALFSKLARGDTVTDEIITHTAEFSGHA